MNHDPAEQNHAGRVEPVPGPSSDERPPGAGEVDPVSDFVAAIGAHGPGPELSTVGPDFAVIHQGARVFRLDGLEPATAYERQGIAFTTLDEPGELLSTFATVNDVHFGETVCGMVSEHPEIGPQFRPAPGAEPFPLVMNRSAVEEIQAIDPAVLVVKGDLTADGTQAEYDQFRAVYEPAFGDRMVVVRGNHESYNHATFGAVAHQSVTLPGATLAVIDTSVDGSPSGTVSAEQLDWLDALAASADRPLLVFGHHHLGDPNSTERADRTFGIDLAASAELLALVARRPSIRGYFCGHTHRNRVRRFAESGDVPWVEVGCVKDHPGSWAEYRVYEHGINQIHHRISSPKALAWSEQTRHMYEGLYHDYAFGSIDDRCFTIPADPAHRARGVPADSRPAR